MSIGVYKVPTISTYTAAGFTEIIGPGQTAYISVEGWRGTKLEQPEKYEYRLAKSQNCIHLVRLNAKGGIKNV